MTKEQENMPPPPQVDERLIGSDESAPSSRIGFYIVIAVICIFFIVIAIMGR